MAPFRLNPRLERELRGHPAFSQELAEAAEPAREHAERFAEQAGGPWMPRKGVPRQLELIAGEDGELLLANLDHGGHLLEYGSKNNPPHAPLRRGAQAAGLRLGGDDT